MESPESPARGRAEIFCKAVQNLNCEDRTRLKPGCGQAEENHTKEPEKVRLSLIPVYVLQGASACTERARGIISLFLDTHITLFDIFQVDSVKV